MDDPPRLVADAPVVGPDYAALVAAAREVGDGLVGDSGFGYYLDLRDARPVGLTDDGASLRWEATAHIVVPGHWSDAF